MNLRIGVLGSTNGTSLLPIINAIETKQLQANIAVIISDKQDSGILDKAIKHEITSKYVNPIQENGKKKIRQDFDNEVTNILEENNVELVLMIGYMRIVSKQFTDTWRNKCLNVHPSLLPEFAKGMDMDVHSAVLQSGKSVTGCTVHYVTEEVDGGPILCQEKCNVSKDDTTESLKKRVQELEGKALIFSINTHINMKLKE